MDDNIHGVAGAKSPEDALRNDPLFRLLRQLLTMPVVLGLVVTLIAVAMVIFSPAAPSHFIYTDF